MSETEGENLRRGALRNIDRLFSNGVDTKEMERQTPIAPSQLPIERRKLLTHLQRAPEANVKNDGGDEDNEDSRTRNARLTVVATTKIGGAAKSCPSCDIAHKSQALRIGYRRLQGVKSKGVN
jgi:hypothetical protein